MNTKIFRKSKLSIVILLITAVLFSLNIQTAYAVESTIPESTVQVSDNSVDTSELTSQDWSRIQEELKSGTSEVEINFSSKTTPFEKIKSSDGTEGNDGMWLFLVGIVLLILGVLLLAMIIFLNIRSRHIAKPQKVEKSE